MIYFLGALAWFIFLAYTTSGATQWFAIAMMLVVTFFLGVSVAITAMDRHYAHTGTHHVTLTAADDGLISLTCSCQKFYEIAANRAEAIGLGVLHQTNEEGSDARPKH